MPFLFENLNLRNAPESIVTLRLKIKYTNFGLQKKTQQILEKLKPNFENMFYRISSGKLHLERDSEKKRGNT